MKRPSNHQAEAVNSEPQRQRQGRSALASASLLAVALSGVGFGSGAWLVSSNPTLGGALLGASAVLSVLALVRLFTR